MPEVENEDMRGVTSSNPAINRPDLNKEEWGSGDIILSDEDGRWIQADESVCIAESEWR